MITNSKIFMQDYGVTVKHYTDYGGYSGSYQSENCAYPFSVTIMKQEGLYC